MRETIGDVDLLVASDEAAPDHGRVRRAPVRHRVIAHGDTKSSILTDRGLQVDLRVVPKDVWGAAMIYFTGSKAHNVRIRERAVRAGLKLNEYGLFDAKTGDLLAAETEAGGLRASRAAVHRADAPGGSRRGRGGARRRAAEGPAAEGPPRRPPHPHEPDRRAGPARGDACRPPRRCGYAYYAVTDHAPEPGDAADDRRQDPRPARAAARAAGRARDDAAARDRAEHRPGRQRRLARGVPGRVRPDGGVGPLALHPVARGA